MPQRAHEHISAPGRGRPRRSASRLAELQRDVGNRGMTHLLARQRGSSHGTFEHSVQVGKLAPIEVKESNVGDWTGKKAGASDLVVTTAMGKHSGELKRMADGKTRIDKLRVQSISGQNSWVIVTFEHARLRGYEADPSGKTERWKAVDFDAVHIDRTSIGKPRP